MNKFLKLFNHTTIYAVIISSLTHAIIVILTIFLIFQFVLIKKNDSEIIDNAIDIVDKFVKSNDNVDENIEFKKLLLQIIPEVSEENIIKEKKEQKLIDDHNKKYYNDVIIFFSVLTLITILFSIIYYLINKNKINFILSYKEIIIGTLFSFGLIILYQFLFAYEFIFRYIDFQLYDIILSKINFISSSNIIKNITDYVISYAPGLKINVPPNAMNDIKKALGF
jgi:hypothetical protein